MPVSQGCGGLAPAFALGYLLSPLPGAPGNVNGAETPWNFDGYAVSMPRMARVVVPGVPHHVTQRGNT